MKTKTIRVRSAAGEYAVLCGAGILRHAADEIEKLGEFSSVHVLTSPKVWRATGKAVKPVIPRDASQHVHLFDDAETKKNMRTVELLCRKLTGAGADRATHGDCHPEQSEDKKDALARTSEDQPRSGDR